ncbi:hypothetical protein ACKXGF_05375 [Alkalibacillus sp. S2W]|uniref:hypothetical protein n=1 Tax=Alkalibacillus sp. S2W TaxID=3386553 RepID=UPI00398C9B91
MGQSKKEIHVNDLIIRAENVVVEPTEKQSQPWIGREVKSEHHHEADTIKEEEDDLDDDHHHDKRPPFSWI